MSLVMHTGTVRYSDSRCNNYSLKHQMCINPQLKIVPKVRTGNSCLNNVLRTDKNTSARLFGGRIGDLLRVAPLDHWFLEVVGNTALDL